MITYTMFNKLLSNLIKYDQKSDWDKYVFGYMRNANIILDAGCGLGRFIAINPKKIIGLENNPKNLEIATKKGYMVTQGNITAIPFENEKFDAIFCSHVIEHLTPNELHSALKEFDRVLKDEGILAISSPLLWKHFYSDLSHIKPYNPDAIIHYLTGGKQRTNALISEKYTVIKILWRHMPLTKIFLNIDATKPINKALLFFLSAVDFLIYKLKLGFLVKNNGYLLIMKKNA